MFVEVTGKKLVGGAFSSPILNRFKNLTSISADEKDISSGDIRNKKYLKKWDKLIRKNKVSNNYSYD